MLRFDRIRIHEMGPFKDVDVDFSALPAIVAVTGGNGEGKSSLLELLGGALWRECPTRGSLSGLARGRDSWVEVDVTNGRRWSVKQFVDAISGKGEALVVGDDGAPAFDSSKVRAHDAWAAAHLPAPGVLYASTIGVQGSAGFLALKPADRKAILLRILGIERFEVLAERARERARAARDEHALAVARLGEVAGLSIADADNDCDRARGVEADAAAKVEIARAALEEARTTSTAIAEALRARRERAEAFEALLDRALRLRAEIGVGETRIGNNQALLNQRADIEFAARQVAAYRQDIATLSSRIDVGQAEERRLDALISAACAPKLEALAAREERAEARARRARPIAKTRPFLDIARAQIEGLTRVAADDQAAVRAEQLSLDAILAQVVLGAEDRVSALRGGMGAILSDPDDARSLARKALDADDQAAEFASQVPRFQAAARESLAAAVTRAQTSARAEADARRVLDGAVDVEAAEADLLAIVAELAAIAAERKLMAAETEQARADRASARAAIVEARAQIAHILSVDLPPVEERARQADRVAVASARIEELESSLARARAELAEVDAKASAMGTDDAADLPAQPDLEGLGRQVQSRDAEHRAAAGRLAVAERDVEAARTRDCRRAELEVDRDRIAVALADWTRLAADLGKDGIQALEIDAAGPELSALANDLLHTCVGPRWTVTVDTQRMGSDGRLLESLEVRVLDTEAGRDAPVETYSGGERVLIGEAVSLALAMLACRRSGMRDVTIIRDESGAALDGDKARAYVAMLRRAVQLTGARQVLLVTHSSDVADLCDARLHVEGGRVEVRA